MIIRCTECGNVMQVKDTKDWNDEQAREEYFRLYPGAKIEEAAIICHACHVKSMVKRDRNLQ